MRRRADNEKGGTRRDERWKPKYTDKTQRTERTRKEDERKSDIGEVLKARIHWRKRMIITEDCQGSPE